MNERKSEDPVDLLEYWVILRRRAGLILTVVMVITGAVAVYAFSMPAVYRAEVLMAPAVSEGGKGGLGGLVSQYGGLAALAGIEMESGGGKEEALAILKSRAFLSRFIQAENLAPVFFSDDWEPTTESWREGREPTMTRVTKFFLDHVLRVTEGKNSGMVTLAIEWTDREKAADWANRLLASLNAHMRQRAIAEANKSLSFLGSEMGKTGKIEIQAAISRLIETQMQQAMMANVRDEYSFKVIDPAVVPAEDDYVKPRRWLLVAFGLTAGLLLGATLAFLGNYADVRRGPAAS